MFMGEYSHTVDQKGRMIVPSKFREQLGDEFVVTKGLDRCLYIYPKTEWDRLEEQFTQVPLIKKEAREFARFFFAGAANCEVDKQGRILLPQVLRSYAGIDKDVVLAGVMNKVEIWSKDRYDSETGFDDLEAVAEKMAEYGVSI